MNLLFTGRGSAGSWKVRGEQLGNALGAQVMALADAESFRAADLVVVVKRTPSAITCHLGGKRWVWDIIDSFPQPGCRYWSRSESIQWVRQQIKSLRPTAMIWPNERMREDCDTGLPGLVLPHHHRPGIATNPIRKKVQTVGYEGRPAYLGKWEPRLNSECQRRGWRFVVNPAQLSDLDIVVAVRGGQWESYAATHWKSNVKLANAHGSGTPFVAQQECGYIETSTGAEYWVEGGLSVCFDWLEKQSVRQEVSQRFRAAAFSVDQAAERMMGFLRGL